MKKLVFLFALVLAVSFAMAQKTTTIVQSGTYNTATVDQMACMSGADNTIFATQSGDFNGLVTTQLGWDNTIDLMQSGDNNTADITQETCDFDDNHGYNTATMVQSGDRNSADISQMETAGDDNDGGWWIFTEPELDRSINYADAKQSGNSNSYTLAQGREEYIPSNTSYLRQSGDYNTADVDQVGFDNYSEIRQNGDWNTADLMQAGADALGVDISKSWQNGARNTLGVKQTGIFAEQLAVSLQNGSHNTTSIEQVGMDIQTVDATQAGLADNIDIDQIDIEE